jgi:hypothetical protein
MGFDRRGWLALNIAVALGATAAATLLDARTAATARPAPPWCANLGGRDGGWDCGYFTFEQCMATARGLGGSCQPNPWAVWGPPSPPPPRRARR